MSVASSLMRQLSSRFRPDLLGLYEHPYPTALQVPQATGGIVNLDLERT